MINNSKIVLFKTTDNREGFLGTPRGITHHLFGTNKPDYHEWFDIDEKISDMIEEQKKEVDEIPEMKQCIEYDCEWKLKVLQTIYDFAKKGDVWRDKRDLMTTMMRITGGRVNPHFMKSFIDEIYEV